MIRCPCLVSGGLPTIEALSCHLLLACSYCILSREPANRITIFCTAHPGPRSEGRPPAFPIYGFRDKSTFEAVLGFGPELVSYERFGTALVHSASVLASVFFYEIYKIKMKSDFQYFQGIRQLGNSNNQMSNISRTLHSSRKYKHRIPNRSRNN